MSRPRNKVCDVCGAVETVEANGWLWVELVDCERVEIHASPLEDSEFAPAKCFDVCGEGCAMRKVEELLPRLRHQRED